MRWLWPFRPRRPEDPILTSASTRHRGRVGWAVAAGDARIDLEVNTDVASESALRTVALAVSAAASPVAVDALTVITLIVVWPDFRRSQAHEGLIVGV